MAKKVFYAKHYKLPKNLQLYVVWLVFFIITLPFIWWLGSESLGSLKQQYLPKPGPALSATNANFAQNFLARFYDRKGGLQAEKLPELFRSLRDLKLNGWQVKPLVYDIDVENPLQCRNLFFSKKGASNNYALYMFPWSSTTSSAGLYTGLQLMSVISASSTQKSTGVIFYGDFENCKGNAELTENLSDNLANQVSSVLTVAPSSIKSGFEISGENAKFASLLWRDVFPEIGNTSLLQNLAQAAFSIARRESSMTIPGGLPGLTYYAPGDMSGKVLSDLILPAAGRIDSVKHGGFSLSGPWLSNTFALTRGGLWTILIFLCIVIWFPAANRIILDKSPVNLFGAVFSAIYFSMAILLLWASLAILSGITDGQMTLLISFLIFIISIPVLSHYEKKLFMVENPTGSALVLINILLMLVAFINPVVFIALLTFIFLGSRIRRFPLIPSILLAIICTLPLIYLLYQLTGILQPPGQLLEPPTYLRALGDSIPLTVFNFFLGGAIIALLHKSDDRRRGM